MQGLKSLSEIENSENTEEDIMKAWSDGHTD